MHFGFFLLISAAMWTLNKFSYSYTYELSAKIELTTPNPTHYTITSGSITPVQLRVRARGYDALRYKMFVNKKIRVSVAPTEQSANSTSTIATAQLLGAVAQQLGGSYELQGITPDSITFATSRVISKKVPVQGDFRISTAAQHLQRGAAQLTPDSVVVSGAESYVQNINKIHTEPLVRERLSGKISGRLDLIAPPGVQLSHQKASYSIDIQRFVEVSYELPIRVLGAPDTLSVTTLPATSTATFSVTMEDYPRLRHEDLYFLVNYNELSLSISDQLQVQLSSTPGYVLSTAITPPFANVIAMRRQ